MSLIIRLVWLIWPYSFFRLQISHGQEMSCSCCTEFRRGIHARNPLEMAMEDNEQERWAQRIARRQWDGLNKDVVCCQSQENSLLLPWRGVGCTVNWWLLLFSLSPVSNVSFYLVRFFHPSSSNLFVSVICLLLDYGKSHVDPPRQTHRSYCSRQGMTQAISVWGGDVWISVPPEAYPETKTWLQIVYLGD